MKWCLIASFNPGISFSFLVNQRETRQGNREKQSIFVFTIQMIYEECGIKDVDKFYLSKLTINWTRRRRRKKKHNRNSFAWENGSEMKRFPSLKAFFIVFVTPERLAFTRPSGCYANELPALGKTLFYPVRLLPRPPTLQTRRSTSIAPSAAEVKKYLRFPVSRTCCNYTTSSI